MKEIYKQYLDHFTRQEWAGLLYIHTFHSLEFNSSLDESLQIFTEMLWVNKSTTPGIDLDELKPISALGSYDINVHNTQHVFTLLESTIDWDDPILAMGKEFILATMPDYHNKIDRAIDKHKETAMLVSFYNGTIDNDPTVQKRMQIFLEDDMSDYYSVWTPDKQ
jgi:hypothetical protein